MDEFERVLTVLNEMVEKRVINTYAIGGGHAAIIYTEPFLTEDVDVFVIVRSERENSLDYLRDVNDFLVKTKGYSIDATRPYVKIEDTLVQFLPASEPPYNEAVEKAIEIPFGQTTMRLISAEHLVALMLVAGRSKDYNRIDSILKNKLDFDMAKLNDIIERQELTLQWNKYKKTRV